MTLEFISHFVLRRFFPFRIRSVTAWSHGVAAFSSGLMYCRIQGHSWIPSAAKRPNSRCCDGESTNLPSSPLLLFRVTSIVAMMITQRARNVFPARVVQPDRRQRPRRTEQTAEFGVAAWRARRRFIARNVCRRRVGLTIGQSLTRTDTPFSTVAT